MRLTSEQADFLGRCGVEAAQSPPVLMERLFEDLVRANRRMNLTRITSPEDFWTLHVLDSLSVALVAPELMQAPPKKGTDAFFETEPGCRSSLSVADVGCGGGFPMLPLAWAAPALRIVGIESRKRKAEFVREEAKFLGFTNCSVAPRQAREVARSPDCAGRFDIVLLRAVGASGEMIRECRNLLKGDGAKIINYKTPEAVAEERRLTQREAKKFGFEIIESEVIDLPREAGRRQFVILTKQR
jgi:16S rRNA (guanine527-N7)-methyltransferase